jgi:hypothetical protein
VQQVAVVVAAGSAAVEKACIGTCQLQLSDTFDQCSVFVWIEWYCVLQVARDVGDASDVG